MAPERTPEPVVRSFVESKQHWIARHVHKQQSGLSGLAVRKWQHGETLWLLGQPITLHIHRASTSRIIFNQHQLHLFVSSRVKNTTRKVRLMVQEFYQQQARQWLDDKGGHLISKTGLQPEDIAIRSFKARWGSCSKQGGIALTWHLFAAPEPIVRYVFLHELCHLRIFNHSASFWKLVKQHMPQYRDAEQWIKQFGATVLDEHYFALPDAALASGEAIEGL